MNIQEEIINDMSKALSDDIDFEIITGMLCELGWHKVKLDRFWKDNDPVVVLNWCDAFIKNNYEHRNGTFVFEDSGDAVNFTMKWL